VWSLAEAREALERLVGRAGGDWSRIDEFLIAYIVEPAHAKTVFASSFAAALELVKEGQAELHQQSAFSPLFVRKRPAGPHAMSEPGAGAPPDATTNANA
jgi:segregation and condensation protein A